MNTVTKLANWKPATLRDEDVDAGIPFILTQSEKTHAAIIRCDIEAMRRRFREPEGLTVTDATQADFDEARRVLVL